MHHHGRNSGGFSDSAADPNHRNGRYRRVGSGLRCRARDAVVGDDDYEEAIPSRRCTEAVHKSSDAGVGVGKRVEADVAEMVIRYIPRLVTAKSQNGAEERIVGVVLEVGSEAESRGS